MWDNHLKRLLVRSMTLAVLWTPGFFHPLIAQEPLTLRKAIETGLQNNYSILIQHNEAEISRNNNTLGNAGFLPALDLNVTQNTTIANTHQEQFSGTIKDVSGAQNRNFNAGVALRWTIFDGLQMFASKKMLNILEDLGENGTRMVVEGTVSDIILTYSGMIQLQKMVQVMRDAVDLSLQRKRIAEAKLTFGAGSELMLLQSTVDLNADSTQLISQENSLNNTLVDLNRILATDIDTRWEFADSIQLNDTLDFGKCLANALQQNATLISVRLNQAVLRQEVRITQSGRYPRVDLSGGYTYSTLNSQTGFLQYNRSYGPSYGITLSYNLFNGFNLNHAIRNAKIALNSGDLETRDAELELRATLRKLFNQYHVNLEIIRMQVINVRVAQENVNVAFEKYKLGSLDDIGLREIQNKLIDAQSQLILSQFEAKKAETEILRLSGFLFQSMK
ncbi:MAG: TolC family protein [Bacteroidales bacterium]|nr:TolC family protein [Bacteroidales bacterium]